MNKNVDLMTQTDFSTPDTKYWPSKLIYEHEQIVTMYTSKWSHYFDLYDRYFSKFRYQKPVVLEIGVDNGGSMQLWRNFFGFGSKIYGFDIRPKVHFDDMIILQGDQGNPEYLDSLVNMLPHFDIVIDDGSHFSEHQILTFKKLFPHMNEGGVYFVEDTHSSYMDTFNGNRHRPDTFINWCKGIVDILHEDYDNTAPTDGWKGRDSNLYRHIDSIHFHDSVIVFDKKLRPKNEVTYVHRDSYIR